MEGGHGNPRISKYCGEPSPTIQPEWSSLVIRIPSPDLEVEDEIENIPFRFPKEAPIFVCVGVLFMMVASRYEIPETYWYGVGPLILLSLLAVQHSLYRHESAFILIAHRPYAFAIYIISAITLTVLVTALVFWAYTKIETVGWWASNKILILPPLFVIPIGLGLAQVIFYRDEMKTHDLVLVPRTVLVALATVVITVPLLYYPQWWFFHEGGLVLICIIVLIAAPFVGAVVRRRNPG